MPSEAFCWLLINSPVSFNLISTNYRYLEILPMFRDTYIYLSAASTGACRGSSLPQVCSGPEGASDMLTLPIFWAHLF